MDEKKQEGERPSIVDRLVDPATGRPRAQAGVPFQGSMVNGLDADDIKRLKADPSDEDGRLDVNVDETFPASDAPSMTQPGKGHDGPRPGGKYD